MLILNGEPLNLVEPKKKIEKDITLEIKEIQARKKPMIIEHKKPYQLDDKGRKINFSPTAQRLKRQIVNNSGVPERWVLCDTPEVMNNGQRKYPAKMFICNNSVSLDPKSMAEMIWFIQKTDCLKDTRLKIKDYEAEAQKEFDMGSREFHVQEVIYGSRLSEEQIQLLAMSWNVPEVETSSMQLLKMRLLKTVKVSEKNKDKTGRGYDEFITEADNFGEDVNVNAFVNKAIELSKIEFVASKSRWYYKGTDNSICTVPPLMISIKEKILVDKLLKDEDKYEEFKLALEGEVDFLAKIGIDNLDLLKLHELKQHAKDQFGYEFDNKATKADVIKRIRDGINK